MQGEYVAHVHFKREIGVSKSVVLQIASLCLHP